MFNSTILRELLLKKFNFFITGRKRHFASWVFQFLASKISSNPIILKNKLCRAERVLSNQKRNTFLSKNQITLMFGKNNERTYSPTLYMYMYVYFEAASTAESIMPC